MFDHCFGPSQPKSISKIEQYIAVHRAHCSLSAKPPSIDRTVRFHRIVLHRFFGLRHLFVRFRIRRHFIPEQPCLASLIVSRLGSVAEILSYIHRERQRGNKNTFLKQTNSRNVTWKSNVQFLRIYLVRPQPRFELCRAYCAHIGFSFLVLLLLLCVQNFQLRISHEVWFEYKLCEEHRSALE